MTITRTVLNDLDGRSGEYSISLRDASSLLVEERKNFVPVYMSFDKMNYIERRVEEARRKNPDQAITEEIIAGFEIEAYKGFVKNMLRGMSNTWNSPYVTCALLSNDIYSSNPAATKPQDKRFSFQLSPKEFVLGLTGRLLEDDKGNRHQEELAVGFNIYDVFSFATELSPQTIVAVGKNGNQTVIYEDGKPVGSLERFDCSRDSGRKRIRQYVMSESAMKHYESDDIEVLPTNGMKIVFSDFWEKMKKYERGAMLFGHEYSSMKEFLEAAMLMDQHIIWDVCGSFQTQYGGHDAPIIECEKLGDPKKFPEEKDRLQIVANRVVLEWGGPYIRFDKATAVQALMSLGDAVTDIWCEPVDRKWEQGWDIVYDRRRGITPDKPVAVIGATNAERYHVLKDFKSRQR